MRGKRALFTDETPRGATWDEVQPNNMLSGTALSAEGKGKDFVDFKSDATITITGNHKPKFVTSVEDSGIDRRMLLLSMNKKIKEHMADDVHFPQHVVEQEGPGIMMWLVQGALEGFDCYEKNASFFDDGMVDPMVAATANYRRADNWFEQWIDEEMRLDPHVDISSADAFKAFMAWMQEQEPRFHMSKEDFKVGLEAATAGRVFKKRQGGTGRYVFQGLTYANGEGLKDANGNIIAFPKR